MSKKLKQIRLFDGFHHPQEGEFKNQLPPDNKIMKELDMTLEDNGTIYVTWKGTKTNQKHSVVLGVSMWKYATPAE